MAVISTKEDPIKGWVDNVYGPIGFVAGTAAGVLKVSYVDPDAKTEFVPADIVVNTLIAAGARTGRKTLVHKHFNQNYLNSNTILIII